MDPGPVGEGTQGQSGDPGSVRGPRASQGTQGQSGDSGPVSRPRASQGTQGQSGDPGPVRGPRASQGTQGQSGDPGSVRGPRVSQRSKAKGASAAENFTSQWEGADPGSDPTRSGSGMGVVAFTQISMFPRAGYWREGRPLAPPLDFISRGMRRAVLRSGP